MLDFNPDDYLAKHGQDFMPEKYLAAFGEAATTPFTEAGEKISNFVPEPINPPTSSPLSMLQSAAHGVGSLIGGVVGHLTPADLAFGAAGAGDAMMARRAGAAAVGGPAQIGREPGAISPRTNPNWTEGAPRGPVAGEVPWSPAQIEMEGPWTEGVAKVNPAMEMPGPAAKRIGADGRPQIEIRDTYGSEWPMPGPDYIKLPFSPRPDLSPVFKAKMMEVAGLDPVAAMKNITMVRDWPLVEKWAGDMVKAAGPQGRETAQKQLTMAVEQIVAPEAIAERQAAMAAEVAAKRKEWAAFEKAARAEKKAIHDAAAKRITERKREMLLDAKLREKGLNPADATVQPPLPGLEKPVYQLKQPNFKKAQYEVIDDVRKRLNLGNEELISLLGDKTKGGGVLRAIVEKGVEVGAEPKAMADEYIAFINGGAQGVAR